MDNQERKLSSEELEQLLEEVQNEPEVKVLADDVKPKKKKTNVRFDMIIAGIVALVLVVCMVFIIVHLVGKSSTPSSSTKTENPLEDEKYPEISDVVKHYLEAFLIKDAQKRREELAHYVDNMGDINESNIKYNDYITSYRDIECYTKDGPYKNTYVVYAYYQIRLKNISTTVPGITKLYVIRDNNSGDVYIHNGVTGEISDYLAKIDKDKDVINLMKDVDKEFQEACESDKYLKAFFDKLAAKKATTAAATQAASAASQGATKAASQGATKAASQGATKAASQAATAAATKPAATKKK